MRKVERARTVVVGAGVAGAALVWRLAVEGERDVVLLEREREPGTHASGRSASLVLQVVDDDANVRLARESVRFLEDPPPGFLPRPGFRRTGSVLFVTDPVDLPRLDGLEARAAKGGVETSRLDGPAVERRFPLLGGRRVAGGLLCPRDGVVDAHALLDAFVRGAVSRGVRFEAGEPVRAIAVEGGAVASVVAGALEFAAERVVIAAGAWAGALGASAGAPLPLRPTRRHLFVTEPVPAIDRDAPFAWDLSRPFYFRPESGGLLVCACDESDAPDLDESVDPSFEAAASRAAADRLPAIAGRPFARAWAGLRTLTPDDRFAIGPDPRVRGLFWVAGLGGHGITCAPAIGRLAADLLLRGRTDLLDAALVAPARLL